MRLAGDVTEVLCRWDRNADTPLHIAAASGQRDMAKMLVKKGADLNTMNKFGITPLHHACAGNHIDISVYLMEQ